VTVEKLIERLQQLPPTANVRVSAYIKQGQPATRLTVTDVWLSYCSAPTAIVDVELE
jgi:hypothetical protein